MVGQRDGMDFGSVYTVSVREKKKKKQQNCVEESTPEACRF